MAQPPGLPPVPPHAYPFPPQPPAPPIAWYHQKWFVVLMLIFFFPVGLALLWTSPRTKLVGRLIWTILIALMVVSVATSPDAPADKASAGAEVKPSSPPTTAPSTTAKPTAPAAPPKEEYTFTVTNKDTGKVYKGKVASDVGVAVTDVQTATSLGNNMFGRKAQPGAVFVVVQLYVKNEQKDAITLDGSLFTLLYEGREYSYSTEGSTALELSGDTQSFFLKKVNPGLAAQGLIPFEVPEGLDLAKAQLRFRGGMTGKTATVPAKPVTE